MTNLCVVLIQHIEKKEQVGAEAEPAELLSIEMSVFKVLLRHDNALSILINMNMTSKLILL